MTKKLIGVIVALVLSVWFLSAGAQSTTFVETFPGNPSGPQPWQPSDWAVAANRADMWWSSSQAESLEMDPVMAHHGSACEPPLITHTIDTLDQAVFLCRDHVMTAPAAGYAAVYLTPPALLDFTNGEAILRVDVSTLRRSGRDWWDIWITPFEDQVVLPLPVGGPAYNGPPQRAVQVEMQGENRFRAAQFTSTRRGSEANLPVADFTPYDWASGGWLDPAADLRSTFELRLSRTHISFCMPQFHRCWVDTALAVPLDWNVGVVQFGHHSYNACKGIGDEQPPCEGQNTWHWDNVVVEPHLPMNITPSAPRWDIAQANDTTITLQRPAPMGAFVRFTATGNVEVSFDGGPFVPAVRKNVEFTFEHFSSYLQPVPAGTTRLTFRYLGGAHNGLWMVAHVDVLHPQTEVMPSPSSSPSPTSTPTSTSTLTATPTLTPTSTATVAPSPLPCPSTVTFDDRSGQNTGLNGTYACINWGTSQWFHSGPYGLLTTKSVSFVGGRTNATMTLTPMRTLVRIQAYNGGSGSSRVSLSCGGLSTKTVDIPARALTTISTGWQSPCGTVTVTSSNGWDTNFDNLELE